MSNARRVLNNTLTSALTTGLATGALLAGCSATPDVAPTGAAVAVPSDAVQPAPTIASTPGPTPSAFPTETVPGAPMPQVEITAATYLANTETPLRFEAAWDDPTSPAVLAALLIESERYVRTGGDADKRIHAAHRTQRAYRLLGRTPAWRDEVLAALPEELRFIATKNVEAREALASLRGDSPLPTALPAWRILEPAPADDLLSYYREAGEALGVDWEILAAINLVETRMGRIEGFSTAGARGPMQFIPASWDAFGAGGDIDDPRDAIFAAARHLTQRPGNPPSDVAALFNYNNHTAYGVAVLAYADVLRADPAAYRSYHGWQVYFTIEAGDQLLPVGYAEPNPIPAAEYLEREVVRVAH